MAHRPLASSQDQPPTAVSSGRGAFFTSLLVLAFAMLPLAGCGAASASTGGLVRVVAAENFWGSVAAQIGGARVEVKNLITNPDQDPHNYEPTPSDARLVADARYVIVNGAGYDPWLDKLLAANPSAGRKALNIGALVGRASGDNPHLWYNPDFVTRVADQMTADLKALDSAHSATFDQQNTTFKTSSLKTYHDLIGTIKSKYAGAPVGSTESIFADIAAATGLRLTTPPGFMKAVSEGDDIAPADKIAFEQQVTSKQIKVLVVNRQNATPDTDAIKQKAQSAGIPVVAITETLDPASASFEDWQSAQLQALLRALESVHK